MDRKGSFLSQSNASLDRILDDIQKEESDEKDEWNFAKDFWPDVSLTASLGIPIVIGGSCKMVQQFIISVLLGRKSTVLLASVSTAGIWTEWVDDMIRAMSGQCGVLCGQAYGAGNFALVGIWLQICLVLMTVIYPPLACLRLFTGEILDFMGVPAIIAENAGIYARWNSLAMIFELWYFALWGYYTCQGIVAPDMIISCIFIFVASLLIWYGVYYLGMGVYGVALAMSLKRVLRTSSFFGYTYLAGLHKKTWHGWNLKEVFVKERIMVFLGLCVPAMLGAVAENLHWSINAVFAARLGPARSAAFDLMVTMFLIVYTTVWGMCQGFGMIMARRLGQGCPQKAKGIVKVGAIMVYGALVVLASLMYAFNDSYARIVSTDPEVREALWHIRGISSLCIVFCGGNFLIAEVLVKQGRAMIVFAFTPTFNWLIGLPISFFLSPTLGLQGILTGALVAYGLTHAVCGYYVLTTNWMGVSSVARMNSEVPDMKAKREERMKAAGYGQ